MGREWGKLAKISGITFFRLSPHEQKPFAGMVKDGVPNLIRRFNESVFFIGPCFITAYILQTWATHANHMSHRKDPAEFANDQ